MDPTQTITVSRGAADNLGAIVQADHLTLSRLTELFKQAHAVPVTFTHAELTDARAALSAAKAARKAAQDPPAQDSARKAVNAAEKRLERMKRAPWWCAAEFEGGRRDRAHCLRVHAVVGDADRPGTTLARLRERLDAIGCSYALHTSTSHGCEGQERFRVVVPLAAPVDPQLYPTLWQWLAGKLDGMLDPGAKDPTRLNYMPRVPIGATGHAVVCVDDRPALDPASVALFLPTQPTVQTTPEPSEPLTTISDEQLSDLRSALHHPALLQAAAENAFWAECGYALLSLGETGRALWLEFSAAAPNYQPGDEVKWWDAHCTQQPRSDFKHLFKLAASLGWVNPEPARRNAQTGAEFQVVPAPPPQLELQTTAKGIPYSNVSNATLVLAQQTRVRLTYDEFLGKVMIGWGSESPHALEDADIVRVQVELQRFGMTSISPTATADALLLVAKKNPGNVVTDWLDGLEWDGERRLSLLMPRGFGTPADRYHVRAGRNMLLAMIARAYRPGCQVDEALVFEGPQGAFKSSALRVIGGDYFKELTADPRSKDFEQQLRGVWLGEFPELHAMRRPDDVARIKQFITNREDHFRASYGRNVQDYPRRVVLCGSTNEECWLHDPTGGRRFIPVEVGKVDLEWLRKNREQLFAEAAALFKAGRAWWRYPRAEALAKQSARAPGDPWESEVRKYLKGRSEIVDVAEVLEHAIQLPTERQTHAHLTRVGMTLRKLGCERQAQRSVDGVRRRPWSVPAEFAQQPIARSGPVFTPTQGSIADLV